jgi:hypothetical protein
MKCGSFGAKKTSDKVRDIDDCWKKCCINGGNEYFLFL